MDLPLTLNWTLTAGQVAQMFGESEPTFRKRLPARLAAGFPPRLPGTTRFSRPAVENWFRTYGAAAPIEPARISAVDEARELLEQQYAAGKAA